MEKHGLLTATFSRAFLTDFIPGIVMAKIFGQMFLLALPIKSILGSEYSPQKVASQVEYMVVLSIQRLEIFQRRTIIHGLPIKKYMENWEK